MTLHLGGPRPRLPHPRPPVPWLIVVGTLLGTGGVAAQTNAAGDLTVEQMQADLAVFRTRFLEVDRSYSAMARAAAETRLGRIEDRLRSLTPAQFELALAQVVASADNGHTTAFAGPRSRRFNRVGIRVTPFGEEFRVLRARPANADLLGARVVAVDGRRIAEIRDSARTLAGGVTSWRDRGANYLIESPEQLHALGLSVEPGAAHYEFETPTGEHITRRLAGEPATTERVRAAASRWMYPELLPAEVGVWQTLLTPAQAPWSLQEPGAPFRARVDSALNAVVIELRRNNDAPSHPIRRALQELSAVIESSGRQHLVLDMRQNGGGDLNTTRAFMRSLPDLVPGRIFVLMSPWTFSAAISSIGYLEQAAPDRVTLVGEGPGDRLEFFAEGGVVTLPNSGAAMLSATERHDYRTGCRGKPDCHGPVVRNPIAVPSLAPDIPAPWTFAAYAEGRDPALEAVAAALGVRLPDEH